MAAPTAILSGPPAWLFQAPEVAPLDVRAGLAAGQDPLQMLLAAAQAVAPEGVMVVDAPFNPSPLRRILAGMGFSSYGRKLAEGHWRVFFRRDGGADWQRDAEVAVSAEGAMWWREADGLHLDVRQLPPPQPMVAVLSLLESLEVPEPVVVHHDRVPQMLLPELAERGWRVAALSEEPANVRLWLEREA
jgi:Uncharacterized conserved protein (DUF2249).